ncbi:MAG TPA: class I SAM-dependent methyltransferase [Acidiferrobacter sp.]|nr:class I SAM-dependent methyltransferase [Acidiferrobacter sp.]
MPTHSDDLRTLVDATLAHYNARAEAFWAATRDHDVRQNRESLLAALGPGGPWTLLDLGCGPGRDLKAFSEQGHRAIGVDGAGRFVEMAASFSGCEVWHQDFLSLDLPEAFFDGIFANASLFHVPRQSIARVLSQLRVALRSGGILLSSNPRGANEEGYRDGRYGVLYDWPAWSKLLGDAGFVEVMHYYRPPDVAPEQQRWIASVWRRE